MNRPQFQPAQAVEIARAFESAGVEYLFIGKSAAILLGYPAVTQDVDIFAARSEQNGRRIVIALRKVGFELEPATVEAIVAGKDFVQIKNGPFDVDLIYAPDGISDFETANSRSLYVEGFHIANLKDIIASKRASGREKDLLDLPLLERFKEEYEKRNPRPLQSAAEIARKRIQ